MAQEPSELGRAELPKRGSRIGYRRLVLILACVAVLSIGGHLLLSSRAPAIKVGENMSYGVYVGDRKVGSLTLRITGTTTVENAECYAARYLLTTGNVARAGELKFDGQGNLRRATIALAENLSLRWRTEVGYSFADRLMRVIVEDNRDPGNYRESDVYINLTAEIMVPEHVWYLLRFEPLRKDYRREFHLNLLPDATLNVKAAIRVTGEEVIETPAGRFECWVLEGENTRLASWPVDKIWVAKNERLVARAVEWQDDIQIEYRLERVSP